MKALEVINQIDEGQLDADDLREYSTEMLADRFELTEEDAGTVALILAEQTDPRFNMYDMPAEKADLVLVTIQESIHQSFDGWPEEHQLVIRAYLADLAHAVSQSE